MEMEIKIKMLQKNIRKIYKASKEMAFQEKNH